MRSLKGLSKEALFIRAPRGLQNEEGGLYPLPIIEANLPSYPKLKLVNLVDVNHYDMFLSKVGSEQIADVIYGASR